MNDGFIKVAAATPKIKVADCINNAEKIIEIMNVLDGEGVKLAVFPELCITGYTCGDLFFQKKLIDSAQKALRQVRTATARLKLVTVIGCPLTYCGKLYNCAVAIQRGKILGIVPKTFLPNYNEFYEMRHFSSFAQDEMRFAELDGETVPFGSNIVFNCRGIDNFTFGVEICEDLWATNPPSVMLARNGAHIILNLSASNEMIGKAKYRRQLVSGQSGRLICGYVYADAGEGESTGDLVFAGHNMIAENGVIIAENKLFDNKAVISEIDVQKLAFERGKNTGFTAYEKEPEIVEFTYTATTTTLTRFISKTPFVPLRQSEKDNRCDTILSMQSYGLKKRLEHTGAKRAVIGISGGLDSCLALLVSVRAMDLLNRPHTDVLAITMPCLGTTTRTRSNAEKLCEVLGVSFREIDITSSVVLHFSDIGHDTQDHNVVYENGQARERTQVLMDVANEENGLVIGTGDLSELALGWATYNGDHMSMYGVNASVPKTLIRHIVRYFSDISEDAQLKEVLLDILDTPVSPELLPATNGEISQKTEDLVGPYELHDFFLYYGIRWGFPPKKVLRLAEYAFKGEYDHTVILKWLKVFYKRFFAQQFKRSCLPDGVKVGSVSLSPRGDWRMPSDASVRMWLDELENN